MSEYAKNIQTIEDMWKKRIELREGVCEQMSELKPCPFCSAEPEILSDGRRTWGLVQHNDGCLFPTYPKHEIPESDFAAWNTRAERTCKWELEHSGTLYDKWRCSECGYLFVGSRTDGGATDFDPKFCPECGAKVVGE